MTTTKSFSVAVPWCLVLEADEKPAGNIQGIDISKDEQIHLAVVIRADPESRRTRAIIYAMPSDINAGLYCIAAQDALCGKKDAFDVQTGMTIALRRAIKELADGGPGCTQSVRKWAPVYMRAAKNSMFLRKAIWFRFFRTMHDLHRAKHIFPQGLAHAITHERCAREFRAMRDEVFSCQDYYMTDLQREDDVSKPERCADFASREPFADSTAVDPPVEVEVMLADLVERILYGTSSKDRPTGFLQETRTGRLRSSL